MTNGNSRQPALPKTATMPMPPPPRPQSGPEAYAPRGHNSFLAQAMHEDVGRVMQNIIDLQAEVAALRKSNQEWERRALLAEGKVEQLRGEIGEIKDDFNKDVEILKKRHDEEIFHVQRELDHFKQRDAVVQTKLAIGAQHFLDCISAIDKEAKERDTKILTNIDAELTKVIDEANKNEPEPIHD